MSSTQYLTSSLSVHVALSFLRGVPSQVIPCPSSWSNHTSIWSLHAISPSYASSRFVGIFLRSPYAYGSQSVSSSCGGPRPSTPSFCLYALPALIIAHGRAVSVVLVRRFVVDPCLLVMSYRFYVSCLCQFVPCIDHSLRESINP